MWSPLEQYLLAEKVSPTTLNLKKCEYEVKD